MKPDTAADWIKAILDPTADYLAGTYNQPAR
jgi:hypothetical protein